MPIYSTMFVQKSVGRNAHNAALDVGAVQQRLNDLMQSPRVPLVPDGICGSLTRGMIRDFQINVAGFKWPDSRVDPNGKTLMLLNDPQSESIWARMSIPPANGPTGGGGSGGLDPKDSPKSEFDAVDAAIEQVKATEALTPGQERALRQLYAKLWKANRGGYTMTKTGLSEQDLNDWIGLSKNVFQLTRIGLVIASTHISALVGAAVIFSFIGVILMTAGLVAMLMRSLTSSYRVYGALSMAHLVVWYAHGGVKSTSAQSVIDNYEDFTGKVADTAQFAEAWREGQQQAGVGLVRAVGDTARTHGMTYREADAATKALMKIETRSDLLKIVIRQLAEGFYSAGDVQVANALRSIAESRSTSYPM